MKDLIILSIIFIFVSCSIGEYNRNPSSIEQTKLSLLVDEISSSFNDGLSPLSCIAASEEFYNDLFLLTYKSSEIEQITNPKLLIKRSFESRLIIANYLKYLGDDFHSKKCVTNVRGLIRSLRYLEDYLLSEISVSNQVSNKTFENKNSQLLVNPEFSFNSFEDLKSGDIIISRGNAFTSAAIARIGIDDSQFSHMSFVYKDEDGKLFTTEAHIEVGSVATEFIHHMNQKNARSVVYRHLDTALAHRAAKHMFLKVKEFSKNNKSNINYDFGMDYKSNDELFCSEVVYDGFKYASLGSVNIPRYKTQFETNLVPFLNQIGVRVTRKSVAGFETFSPGDLELDSRFKLVAEWRHPEKVINSRVRDAVLSKMFEWMVQKNYRINSGLSVTAKSYLAYFARRIPLLKESYIEKFPLNMTPRQMKLFLSLDKVGEELESVILNSKNYKKYSIAELFNTLEAFRRKDYRLYKSGQRSKVKLHKYFRP